MANISRAAEITYNLQQRNISDQQERYRLDCFFGIAICPPTPHEWSFIQHSPPKPCQYCGRTQQNHQHKSCDGCGAPKELK